ncbi:Cas10/Cmr2 second palm domain-containing protein [Pseudoalteromonas sp. SS15]|uniref:Cas10/Cmr2 second palm domain-containing protein n=1 Tax=Pseudoalteromonas sp. SS15 TaxID=3139393 RepID=UPI003BAC6452
MFVYLFEARSIQSYLFRSGKLKDVISASERLDQLVDDSPNSILSKVIKAANLDTDLIQDSNSSDAIHFLRCKGGAFYCYAEKRQPLVELRALWTLTLEQLFPSLEYIDAINEGSTLITALDSAHTSLASARNTPNIKLPQATAPTKRYMNTGAVSVCSAKDLKHVNEGELDADTACHREALQNLNSQKQYNLASKFIPDNIAQLDFPINIEEDFKFSEVSDEAIKDIALVHIDGNGLGILLMALKSALKDQSEHKIKACFRAFSTALNEATISAAKKATQYIYDNAKYTLGSKTEHRMMVPMRPIVLGGDDITLLCRADLALTYSKIFCKEFKAASETQLAPLFTEYLSNSELKPFLTASGGILYHKAGHPFTNSHHLVEDLCEVAKKRTKSFNTSNAEVGPSALAIHRLSNSVSDSYEEIAQRELTFTKSDEVFVTAQAAYLVDQSAAHSPFSLENLEALEKFSAQANSAMPMSRWRTMAGHISQGDFCEANRVFQRGCALANEEKVKELNDLLDAIAPSEFERKAWYWTDPKTNQNITFINDLLILHHFKHVQESNDHASTDKEGQHA